jgi:hypothetical protein
MGQVPDLRLLELLNQLRADPDTHVRWLVLKSLSSFNRAGVKPKPIADSIEPPANLPPADLPLEEPASFEPPQAPLAKEPAGPVLNTRTFGRLL